MSSWLKRRLAYHKPIQALLERVRRKPQGPAWIAGEHTEPRERGFLGRSQHRQLSYRLFLPARDESSERLPLLVMLHGCTQSAQQFAEGTRMNQLAAATGFAVLYPEQRKHANALRCWNWFDPEVIAGESEAALIMRVLDEILAKHPIDATRVYLCGFSAGAAMAAVLSARFGARFAACALYSGLMYSAADNAIQALKVMRQGASADPGEVARELAKTLGADAVPVPTLVIRGTADEVVNPINSEQIISELQALCESRGLQLTAEPSNDARSDSAMISARDYVHGNLVYIRSLLIEGLGHAWSGGDSRHKYFEAAGPDASRLILEFIESAERSSVRAANAEALAMSEPAVL
jgi:poly(hydroxyalkanoate) depolymerase family esterase